MKQSALRFAAVGLDHGHINGMCRGLIGAGAKLAAVWDPDPEKIAAFLKNFPDTPVAERFETILDDPAVELVACAAVPNTRCAIGLRVMEAGKDYFCDKAPFTEFEQLDAAAACCARTGRKYFVYYAERVHVESAVLAGDLVASGAIGRVVQVVNLAPHRLAKASRPAWFWLEKPSGGTLCDIGSHQFEQFLFYTGCDDARVVSACRANYTLPEYPEFDDFACATLVGAGGATQFMRVDWLTPDGLSAWGDGRLFLLGTKGFLEIRKYVDLARDRVGDRIFLADGTGERMIPAAGTVGYPYFGALIEDVRNRTETAMTQAHAFAAARLALEAQKRAVRLTGGERPAYENFGIR